MAIPMTGPLLTRNDPRRATRRRLLPRITTARAAGGGLRWLSFGILSVIAVTWAASSPPRVERTTDRATGSRAAGMGGIVASGLEPGPSEDRVSVAEGSPDGIASLAGGGPLHHAALKPVAGDGMPDALQSPIARALRAIDECQARYEKVRDYVCTFSKRERIDGHLTTPHVMDMKARTRPRSVYFRFRQPAAGREAIYIEGRHDGKVLAHDVGLGRLIAGTLRLDPTGQRAMADCRHPITQAGIGPLLDTVEARWTAELDASESRVEFREGQRVGARPCTRIEVTHPTHNPDFMFYRVRLYIDRELGLPIRFEAYDWPNRSGAAPDLVEEYTYSDLRLNVGLGERDFDVSNEEYAFGRF